MYVFDHGRDGELSRFWLLFQPSTLAYISVVTAAIKAVLFTLVNENYSSHKRELESHP